MSLSRMNKQTLTLYSAGVLDLGPGDVYKAALKSAELYNLPHEVLTGSQVNKRFPGVYQCSSACGHIPRAQVYCGPDPSHLIIDMYLSLARCARPGGSQQSIA